MTAQKRGLAQSLGGQSACLASKREDTSLIPQNPRLKRVDVGDMHLSSQSWGGGGQPLSQN